MSSPNNFGKIYKFEVSRLDNRSEEVSGAVFSRMMHAIDAMRCLQELAKGAKSPPPRGRRRSPDWHYYFVCRMASYWEKDLERKFTAGFAEKVELKSGAAKFIWDSSVAVKLEALKYETRTVMRTVVKDRRAKTFSL